MKINIKFTYNINGILKSSSIIVDERDDFIGQYQLIVEEIIRLEDITDIKKVDESFIE